MQVDFNSLEINKLNPNHLFDEKVIHFIQDWFSESKTMQVKTSGSTGAPKTFDIEKEKMRRSAKMTIDFLDLQPQNSALLCLPVEYISGKMMLVRAIENKMKIKIVEPSISPLENLSENIDFCAMTPLQVENSLDKIHLIQKLIVGGAAVSENLKAKIHQAFNPTKKEKNNCIYETYGMSETLSHIALKEIYPKKKSHFHVLKNVKISQNKNGCLEIYAPQIHTEKLQTHDIIQLKNEKEFQFLGRIDNIINSGGAKIFPEKLELLVKKEMTNEIIFIGIPDEKLGEKLTLIIEGKENKTLKNKIKNINFERKFHRPKSIIFVDKIPRTENGKVDRLLLKKMIMENKPLNKKSF